MNCSWMISPAPKQSCLAFILRCPEQIVKLRSYVDTVGCNKKIIAEYTCKQSEEDCTADQMSIKEYMDTFTGDKNKKISKDSRLKRLSEMVMWCQTTSLLIYTVINDCRRNGFRSRDHHRRGLRHVHDRGDCSGHWG